uniref:Uncharacterized protein n=1 Tax=Arundo donax TaxID=35708 RepID=A0A0A9TNK4_ARUDO
MQENHSLEILSGNHSTEILSGARQKMQGEGGGGRATARASSSVNRGVRRRRPFLPPPLRASEREDASPTFGNPSLPLRPRPRRPPTPPPSPALT